MPDDAPPRPIRDRDQFRIEIPPGWRQGRGAFGGLTVGALIRAIEDAVADPARRTRSVTAELPGPTDTGPAALEVAELRRGNAMSTVRAQLAQAGEIRAHAVAILAASRPSAADLAWRELRPPEAPPWREVEPLALGPWPEFAQHFEYRSVLGVPLGGGDARCIGWIRPRWTDGDRGAGRIAELIDAWYPAAMVRMTEMRPCATIAFTLDVVDGLPEGDAPLLYRGTVPVCGDGYFVEHRELWDETGRLVALNQQTFAIIR